jgi:predicted lipoprotein with Yx(FWY)xxD motif
MDMKLRNLGRERRNGRARVAAAFALLAAALALAACGGGGGSGATAATGSGMTSSSGDTVSAASVSGSQVLVDSKGQALYSPDQEKSGKIMCTGSCTSIWAPLMASGNAKPTASSDAGTVGTVKRPDGGEQVTIDGKPLYTFTQEGPNEVTGDGFEDSFGGRSFTWHVIAPGGGSGLSGGGSGSGSSSSGGYSY